MWKVVFFVTFCYVELKAIKILKNIYILSCIFYFFGWKRWRMSAMVWSSPILLLFLFVCSVFSSPSLSISFTRDETGHKTTHTRQRFGGFC